MDGTDNSQMYQQCMVAESFKKKTNKFITKNLVVDNF